MIRQLMSMYQPNYPKVLVHMLHGSKYKVKPYLKRLHRTKDFNKVMHRSTLDPTRTATMLLLAVRLGIIVQLAVGILLIYLGGWHNLAGGVALGLALLISYPFVWAYLLIGVLFLGRALAETS
jgi:uncharacterized membrane protein